ncbi:MAG: hypothetical protein ACR2N5_06625, partial [Solirubrobacterales bacterium]
RVKEEWNLDQAAIERRLGAGAKVNVSELDAEGILDVDELLGYYVEELGETGQDSEADRIRGLAANPRQSFLMLVPERLQTDPSISTE